MMTIKIIQDDGAKTTIYSAKWVERKTLSYINRAEFDSYFKRSQITIELFMMYPQEDQTDISNPGSRSEFQQLFFVDSENNERVIFLQHCNVYIMEGGQTVDSFRC